MWVEHSPPTLRGVQTHFNKVTIFIALRNAPLINSVFQKVEILRETIYVGQFQFTLFQNLQHLDVCRYFVR